MKKSNVITLFVSLCVVGSASAGIWPDCNKPAPTAPTFSGPCAAQDQTKYTDKQALNTCINAWNGYNNPKNAAPTDNCATELATFVQDVNNDIACKQANAPAPKQAPAQTH